MTCNGVTVLTAKRKTYRELQKEIESLRQRLSDSEEALVAIRAGDIDTLVVSGKRGAQVYTLKGADHSYRVLLEGLNEAALTFTGTGIILYCNKRFSAMTKTPHKKLLGDSIHQVIRSAERKEFAAAVRDSVDEPVRREFTLQAADRSRVPTVFSIKSLPIAGITAFCAVVTDISDRKQAEENLEKSKGYYRDLYLEGQRMQDELERLSREILRVQEEERARISREIHDEIGQVLTAMGLTLNQLQFKGDPPGVRKKIQVMQNLLRQGSDFVHHFSHKIHPAMLDHLGLFPTLRSFVREFQQNTGMRVQLKLSGKAGGTTIEQRVAIFRIVQESLTNVLKHSGVRTAMVTIKKSTKGITLQVADEGKGFEIENRIQKRGRRRGLGLLGMRERARALGGELSISSHPGRGTKVRVHLQFAGGGGIATMKEPQNGKSKNRSR